MFFFAYKKLAQFAVWCALPPRRSESPVCATDNKPSCVLHLLGWSIGSRGFSSLERRPEFWVLQWNYPGKNAGAGCHSLPQRIFLSNTGIRIKSGSPTLQAVSLPFGPPGKHGSNVTPLAISPCCVLALRGETVLLLFFLMAV